MRKRNVTLLVILLVIGFAAVSTTLILNGTIGVAVGDDFDVVFTDAKGEDGSEATISPDGKSITFSTSKLSDVDQESILNYEVTNKSRQYDVDVEIQCGIEGEAQNVTSNEYVTIEVNPTHFELEALDKTRGKVNIRLNKVVLEDDMQMEFSCKLVASAKSRNELAEAGVVLSNGSNTVDAKATGNGEVIFNEEDISNKTNILCNNGAIPTIDGETIKVSNVTSKTKCYLNESLADINDELDESKTNILMLSDELDIPDSGECKGASTKFDPDKYTSESTGVCINKDYNDIVLDLNGKKITSATKTTIFINADTEFKITGEGYIGNNADPKKIENSTAILISGADLYIESSKANKCTDNPSDTTSGLCVYGESVIGNWPAKSKSYTNLKNISTSGQIGIRNGNADIYDIHATNNNSSERKFNATVAVVDTAEDVTINGGYYESDYGNVISDTSNQGSLVINDYPTYIDVKGDTSVGIYTSKSSKLVINGSEANSCTANDNELISGLCVYGNRGVTIAEGSDAIVNGGTYINVKESIYINGKSTVQIKGGTYISNRLKALTCGSMGTTCYVNGGTFENKDTSDSAWGAAAAENGANLYLSNVTLIGKNPLRSHDDAKTYICSGTFNSTSEYDIRFYANHKDAYVYYSDLVKFTDLTNTPKVAGQEGVVTGNYTGTCTP